MRTVEPPQPDSEQPWLLGDVAEMVKARLAERGFTASSYGTERWFRADPTGPRCATLLSISGVPSPMLETLSPEIWCHYEALGVPRAKSPTDHAVHRSLEAAWSLLDKVPRVARTTAFLVRSVHLVESCGPGYDVSHSDPELPCSIFLSVPDGEQHVALRVAESNPPRGDASAADPS